MEDYFKSCVARYIELCGRRLKTKDLKKVSTPFIDEGLRSPYDAAAPNRKEFCEADSGELNDICVKVLMKVLYGARMCRYDLLRATCTLASNATRWTREDDRKLHKLMCYINSTLDYRMYGKVGDLTSDWHIACFSDADFAGCPYTLRSTSGVFLKVSGPNTHFPLAGCSKKQTAVSHSTPEAEIIAAALAIRTEGMPSLILFDTILERDVKLEFLEDNQAAMRILETGKNPTLRYMGRTHNVDMTWLFERFKDRHVQLRYCRSNEQAADIFTKHFTLEDKWDCVCNLIGHIRSTKIFCKIGQKPIYAEDKPKKPPPQLFPQGKPADNSYVKSSSSSKISNNKSYKNQRKR